MNGSLGAITEPHPKGAWVRFDDGSEDVVTMADLEKLTHGWRSAFTRPKDRYKNTRSSQFSSRCNLPSVRCRPSDWSNYATTTLIGTASKMGFTAIMHPSPWGILRYLPLPSDSKMTMRLRLDPFLKTTDAERVFNVLQKLNACGLDYAVTGGMALEPALGSDLGRQRDFNDIDVVTSGFDTLPPTLASAFMISHADPHRATGKLAIQLVEPEQRVRVDVFSACGDTLERTRPALIGNLPIKVVAVEDLACRNASEMMCFSRGESVPPKCADDHARAIQVVDMKLVGKAWRDQRREIDPLTYAEASVQIVEALKRDTGKLVKPTYSTDTDAVCCHCYNTANFMVASPKSILPILGYC